MDVKSLFTNIPRVEGINAVAKAPEKIKDVNISSRDIIKFLSLTLYFNNFEFSRKHFLQMKVSSMGSKSSWSYVDIFMNEFETKHIYPRISNLTLTYFRFVNDSLLTFFKEINTVHESIKFDCKYSLKSTNFLDTTVFKNNQRSLSTKLFAKGPHITYAKQIRFLTLPPSKYASVLFDINPPSLPVLAYAATRGLQSMKIINFNNTAVLNEFHLFINLFDVQVTI